MGVRNASNGNNTIQNATANNAAETVIAITPPISQPIDNAGVLIDFFAVVTPGTGNTSATFKLRRGTTTSGTQLNVTAALGCTAAVPLSYSMNYADTPGTVASQQYCLTLTVAGGAGNATVNDVSCAALAL
jgi:hypothetical protein